MLPFFIRIDERHVVLHKEMDAILEFVRKECGVFRLCLMIERVINIDQGTIESIIHQIDNIDINMESQYQKDVMARKEYTKHTMILNDFYAQIKWSFEDLEQFRTRIGLFQKRLFPLKAVDRVKIKTTPLVMGICARQLACVGILLEKGAIVGGYEMALAIRVGCVVLVQLLIPYYYSIVKQKRVPNSVLITSQHCSIVAKELGLLPCHSERCELLNNGKPMQTTLEPMQFTIEQLETTAQAEFANRSMLEYSIIWNKLNILELLLPYSQVTDQMIKSMVRHGNAKTISLILASHPYLLTTTFNSKSLLDEAIERSSIDTALFLYQNNCIPTDTTLFTLAKKVMGHKPDSKYFELFRAIAVHPMTTINKRDEWDRTVLDILLRRSQNPHRHSLQHLVLKLGLDIDKPSAGLTPIQVSILQGDVETIRVLLQYGPKIKPTAFFESIEEMCPGKRKEEMIEVLRGKSVPPLTYLCLRHGIPDYWRLRINPFE